MNNSGNGKSPEENPKARCAACGEEFDVPPNRVTERATCPFCLHQEHPL